MIRKFFKGIVADLTHAVARSKLAAENARLRAERDKEQALVKDLRDKYEYYGRKFREASEERDDLRARLEAAERENAKQLQAIRRLEGTLHSRDMEIVELQSAAERRSPVDREAAYTAAYAFFVDHWKGCNADRYSREIVDAILGAAKAEPEKRCTSVSLGGNRCCKEAGHSGLCSTKSGGVSWDAPDLGAVPLQPPTFTPAPTSEEPSAELRNRAGRKIYERWGYGTKWEQLEPNEQARHIRDFDFVYAIIAADHAAQVKRVGELGEAFTDTNKRLVELADSLCRINETLGLGAVSFKETEAAVTELLSNRNCFARRLEEKTAEVARLSAPCPADGMAAVRWLLRQNEWGLSQKLERAIERGEVLPAKATKGKRA